MLIKLVIEIAPGFKTAYEFLLDFLNFIAYSLLI